IDCSCQLRRRSSSRGNRDGRPCDCGTRGSVVGASCDEGHYGDNGQGGKTRTLEHLTSCAEVIGTTHYIARPKHVRRRGNRHTPYESFLRQATASTTIFCDRNAFRGSITIVLLESPACVG